MVSSCFDFSLPPERSAGGKAVDSRFRGNDGAGLPDGRAGCLWSAGLPMVGRVAYDGPGAYDGRVAIGGPGAYDCRISL